MLETYFVAPKTLERLRSGLGGPYVDSFAEQLKEEQYSRTTAPRYLRSVAHLGRFAELQGVELTAVTDAVLQSYRLHLRRCRCPRSFGGRVNPHVFYGAKKFVKHLRRLGVIADVVEPEVGAEAAVVESFGHWLEHHHGVSAHTRQQYCRQARDLLHALGDDPSRYNARRVRDFFVQRIDTLGIHSAQPVATAMRGFLRYLVAQGLCRAGLDQAIPTIAGWRLARLPRGLSAPEVARLLAACEGDSLERTRDRAVILLLVRLGLRAGDVAQLSLSDIDWEDGSFVVSGKSRTEARLPLSQEVGDTLVGYLRLRPEIDTTRVFLRVAAPIGPLRGGDAISSIVKRAMLRAGVTTPARGAHLLRHTAAKEMLRQGVSLYEIASVLRHRSIETTAHYYAKVDLALLRQVAQPWPEALR